MDEIIRAEYIRIYGDCPLDHIPSLVWRDGLQDFMLAWRTCEQWQERQKDKEQDCKNELDDLEGLLY